MATMAIFSDVYHKNKIKTLENGTPITDSHLIGGFIGETVNNYSDKHIKGFTSAFNKLGNYDITKVSRWPGYKDGKETKNYFYA
jgi:hypothetical protein